MSKGLTTVARLAQTGEIVGVMLTEDSGTEPPEGLDLLSRRFEPIVDILGQICTEYWTGRETKPGETLHLYLLGVGDQVARRGVAQKLVSACLTHSRALGYGHAVTEATNKVSRHIFRKLGFVERARRSYAGHRFEGQAYFASIAEHGGPILMDRSLSAA